MRNRVNAARLTFSVVRLSDEERRQEALAALDQSLKQLEDAVAFASSLAVAQARVVPAAPQPMPLADVFAELAADLAELSLQPAVELRLRTPVPGIGIDGAVLRLALVNLVAGAVQRADRGKAERWVEIRVGAAGGDDQWRVDVEDNGLGLPGVEIAIGADPRTAAPMTRPQIETALAQEAIARLGGRLWVESNGPDRGTVFSFTLNSGVYLGQPSGNP
jgi:signal transduction histidine kinase